ncbi:3D domain-containing protein [Peribacillus loiseleuriae]|uniref:3D domain-containing protein n=1 Tax=Peribacillus loiseleuriae TaxID=1679170 RepID=UPI00380796A8
MKKYLVYLTATFFLVFGFSGVASANTYEVKKGDTLYNIAKKHNVTVNQITTWNNLKSTAIKPKQVLTISASQIQAKPVQVKGAYKTITIKASAYSADCKGCSGITSTGLNLKKNPSLKVISVDPKLIPLGTKVYVDGYGYAIAADKGSAIKGNKIDVFMPSQKHALNWGVKTVNVRIYY